MKPDIQNFNIVSKSTSNKDGGTWVETSGVQTYPRSYLHLTQALAILVEQAYIPMTLARQEEATGIALSANDRKLMQDHYSNRYTLNYYESKGWSPLVIELKALGDDEKPIDYIDADCFSQHMIFDFFDDLGEAVAGTRGVTSDMLTHTITVEGPTGFLRLIQAICAANPQIATSEDYYDALTEHMSSEDRVQSIDSGEALLQVMRESGPDGDHISAESLEVMPSRPHSSMELGMIFDAPDQYNQKPLFSMDDLIAVVEEETGSALHHAGKPRPFMN